METATLDLLKRSAAIPSMPQVAARFLEIIQDPDFHYQEVVDILSTDPGTTSEILRLANSPLFGVTRKITSLSQALTLLGLKRIRSLVLGRYIVESIDGKKTPGLDTTYYWRRSLTTAVLAARLADPLEPKLREEAFISGLLADLGVVILDETLPKQYAPILEQYRPRGKSDLADMELSVMGITHAQASALVLEHWHLPDVVCEAVREHPWETHSSTASRLARIVGAADRISKFLCETPTEVEAVVAACQAVMEQLSLEPAVLARVLADIEQQIEELSHTLRIDVIPSQVYQMIAQKLLNEIVPQSSPA